ncbi:hypothetical protein Mp_3g00620 [Marchantia polymorpha subsp. ruderalis]|uniref:Uncharacterized protein n=2 Tax=Marchantia polymorpha TaxID=3197 RepID=A0AAF6AVY1_MARPO|nr:hypothetical protein MARPO_0007s0058 [Marchantia polymorpha]BBN03915.1 hypothetical protein Mp_3g00620 [Marchantia polymorpha subsp. ruderalis]|eukprot:PTQ47603.1 hypothetical protein MARPO_0007s0058 [Marchantia polymorpha]
MKEDIEQPVIPDNIGSLLRSASQGVGEAVARMVDYGLSADYDGLTAMHLALGEGHVGVIGLLLKCNAHINTIDRSGESSLPNARRFDYTKVYEILVQNGGTASEGVYQGTGLTTKVEVSLYCLVSWCHY